MIFTLSRNLVISLFLFLNLIFAVDYSSEIQPIFDSNCISCHNGSHNTGLDLRSYDAVMSGSNDGMVIVPNDMAGSLLYQLIGDGSMPSGNNPDLTDNEVSIIGEWIDEGALDN